MDKKRLLIIGYCNCFLSAFFMIFGKTLISLILGFIFLFLAYLCESFYGYVDFLREEHYAYYNENKGKLNELISELFNMVYTFGLKITLKKRLYHRVKKNFGQKRGC